MIPGVTLSIADLAALRGALAPHYRVIAAGSTGLRSVRMAPVRHFNTSIDDNPGAQRWDLALGNRHVLGRDYPAGLTPWR